MARITKPASLVVPGVKVQDVPVLVPVDLTEGGFLQVVVGASSLAPPALVMKLPRGCMVGMLGPKIVDDKFPGLKTDKRVGNATVVQLPDFSIHHTVPMLQPVWLPAGGFLQVVLGENPNGLPVPSTPVDAGSMLGIIPPETAEQLRSGLNLQAAPNPFAIVPNGVEL